MRGSGPTAHRLELIHHIIEDVPNSPNCHDDLSVHPRQSPDFSSTFMQYPQYDNPMVRFHKVRDDDMDAFDVRDTNIVGLPHWNAAAR